MLNAPDYSSVSVLQTSNPAGLVPDLLAPMSPSPMLLTSAVRQVAFVDAGLADVETLVAGIPLDTDVYLFDPSSDAMRLMSQVLSDYRDLTAVQIFSHGSNGALQLGATSLNAENLIDYAGLLQTWAGALTADADILLYGCDVAAGSIGQNFVNQIASLTGADVAASTDLTGNASLGGDWELEYQTGAIAASPFAAFDYQGTLANFVVTSLADSPTPGKLTLREAINLANNAPGTDNISFGGFLNGTIALTGGDLVINSDVNINGNGALATIVSGENISRVFRIESGKVAISNMTIAKGFANKFGGGIFNFGTLTVNSCIFRDNSAVSSSGGGILNVGTLTVSSSTFSGNSVGSSGGGIFNNGTLTVSNSTFSGNSAASGGGIFNVGTLTVSNSTFRDNSAQQRGGGIYTEFDTVTLTSNLIQQNKAGNGGGIFAQSGTVNLKSNWITRNTATGTGPDLNGVFVSQRGNVIGKGGGFTGITNLVNGDLVLVP